MQGLATVKLRYKACMGLGSPGVVTSMAVSMGTAHLRWKPGALDHNQTCGWTTGLSHRQTQGASGVGGPCHAGPSRLPMGLGWRWGRRALRALRGSGPEFIRREEQGGGSGASGGCSLPCLLHNKPSNTLEVAGAHPRERRGGPAWGALRTPPPVPLSSFPAGRCHQGGDSGRQGTACGLLSKAGSKQHVPCMFPTL